MGGPGKAKKKAPAVRGENPRKPCGRIPASEKDNKFVGGVENSEFSLLISHANHCASLENFVFIIHAFLQ